MQDIQTQARINDAKDMAFKRAINRRAQVCEQHGIETRVTFCTCYLQALEVFAYTDESGNRITGMQWVRIDHLSPSAFMAWLGY